MVYDERDIESREEGYSRSQGAMAAVLCFAFLAMVTLAFVSIVLSCIGFGDS